MQSVIVLCGKPGAGKGTRLNEFLKETDKKYKVLSVGNLLREARKQNTELGKKAAKFMDKGLLVPDNIINAIVIDGMKKSKEPILSDGYPRTIGQAQAMIDAGINPIIIDCEVDDEVVIQRAKNRLVCDCGETYTTDSFKPPIIEGICDKCGKHLHRRPDDNPEVVKQRLDVYRSQTEPILEFMQEHNVEVHTISNGDSDSETAKKQFADIMNS